MKKLSLIAVMAVMVISTFAARPGLTLNAQSAPTIAAQKCAAPGKLTMWVWDPNWDKVLTQSIANWTAKYCPGATVDLQQHAYADYWNLVQTNAAAGSLPDVFNMSQDRFVQYASNGALLDLQPYFDKSGLKTTTWGAGEINPYRYGPNNDAYAAPLEWVTAAIYYNKDMFDAAKIAYPTASWTWDDFAKDADALTDASKDQYGAAVYEEYQAGYANWIASAGVTPVVTADHTQCTLTDPKSVATLNWLKGLLDKGDMPKVSIIGGSSADDTFNFFINGKVAMVLGGSWKLPDATTKIKFNWDVVQMPKNPTTGLSRAILHSTSYVASAKTQNPQLAADLIQYLDSDEGEEFFAKAGGVAPADPNPALQQEWMDSFGKSGKNIQAFVDATKDSQGVSPFGDIWDFMDTEIVVNIFDQGMSVEDATAKACAEIAPHLAGAAAATPGATMAATAAQ